MTLKTIGAFLLVIVIVLAARSDFGFYRPDVGAAAQGHEEVQAEPHQREIMRIVVRPEDLQRFGNALTLKRLSEFYGVDDSLPCSIRKTYGNTDPALANRSLRADQVVWICLN
jgi:hypothetical protein